MVLREMLRQFGARRRTAANGGDACCSHQRLISSKYEYSSQARLEIDKSRFSPATHPFSTPS